MGYSLGQVSLVYSPPDVLVLDCSTWTWSVLQMTGAKLIGRFSFASAIVGSSIYIFGGYLESYESSLSEIAVHLNRRIEARNAYVYPLATPVAGKRTSIFLQIRDFTVVSSRDLVPVGADCWPVEESFIYFGRNLTLGVGLQLSLTVFVFSSSGSQVVLSSSSAPDAPDPTAASRSNHTRAGAGDCSVEDRGNGLYELALRTTHGLESELHIKLDGFMVPGFPLGLPIAPAEAQGAQSVVVAGSPALASVLRGFSSLLWLQAVDAFGNAAVTPAQAAASAAASVVIRALRNQSSSPSAAAAADLAALSCTAVQWRTEGTVLARTVESHANGTFAVVFQLPAWDQGSVLLCAELLGQGVANAPFRAAVADPPVCAAGEGFDGLGCATCGYGFYNLRAGGACRRCPDGALCPGASQIVADVGFYQSARVQDKFHFCFVSGACCPQGSCQNAAWASATSSSANATDAAAGVLGFNAPCAAGRTGALCARCVDGHAEWGGDCVPCSDGGAGWRRILLLLSVYALSMCMWVAAHRCFNAASNLGAFRIVVEYAQNAGLVLVPVTGAVEAVTRLPLLKPDLFALNGDGTAVCMASWDPLEKVRSQ
jgi:hypothetical protein